MVVRRVLGAIWCDFGHVLFIVMLRLVVMMVKISVVMVAFRLVNWLPRHEWHVQSPGKTPMVPGIAFPHDAFKMQINWLIGGAVLLILPVTKSA